jgi:hypothetical protein
LDLCIFFGHFNFLFNQHILCHQNGKICWRPYRFQCPDEGAEPTVDEKLDNFGNQLIELILFIKLLLKALFQCLNFVIILVIFMVFMAMNFTRFEFLQKMLLYIQYCGFLMLNWLPVASPMTSIWINTPYRDAVKKFVTRLFKNHAITPVQHLTQPLTI